MLPDGPLEVPVKVRGNGRVGGVNTAILNVTVQGVANAVDSSSKFATPRGPRTISQSDSAMWCPLGVVRVVDRVLTG